MVIEQLEFELIKAAMQGLLSNPAITGDSHDPSTIDWISNHAIKQAKDIIKKIKE